MQAEAIGRNCVEAVWSAGHRCGVLTSTLRRPGRGHSPRGTNRGGWRVEDRPAVLARLDQVVAAVVRGLAAGTLAVADARAQVAAAGFIEAVHVAEAAEELAGQVAGIIRAGDNVWVDCSPEGGTVVYLRWWADPSHPRLG